MNNQKYRKTLYSHAVSSGNRVTRSPPLTLFCQMPLWPLLPHLKYATTMTRNMHLDFKQFSKQLNKLTNV